MSTYKIQINRYQCTVIEAALQELINAKKADNYPSDYFDGNEAKVLLDLFKMAREDKESNPEVLHGFCF